MQTEPQIPVHGMEDIICFRPFVPDDAETILRWCKDRTSFRLWSADRYKDFPASPDDMIAQYSGSGLFPFTMTINNRPCGHLLMRYPSEDRSVIRFGFVIINDNMRNKGYGKRLLQLAIQHASNSLKAKKLTLGVFKTNTSAIKCYESAGFRYIGTDSYKIDGQEWDGIEMELTLG